MAAKLGDIIVAYYLSYPDILKKTISLSFLPLPFWVQLYSPLLTLQLI